VQGSLFEPPQPLFFCLDVSSKVPHRACRRSQHTRDVAALAMSPIDLGSKGIGCDRTPDRDGSRVHELVTDEFDAGGSLLEFSRKTAEI